MQDAEKWVEQDLLDLITNSVQENIQLDYKACGALQNTDGKKNEISKDVSALANSAGGVIIYGMVEEGHIPTRIDEGYDPSELTKEWPEQIITSRIQQKIDGVIINPIELSTTSPGRVAYVVIVPQSQRAPHQASDKRFYKRYNFKSAPMEEYEIRDVSNRHNGPALALQFDIVDKSIVNTKSAGVTKSSQRIKIMPLIENHSPVPAEYIAINLYIDNSVGNVVNSSEFSKETGQPVLFEDKLIMCQRFYMNHATQSKIPIFQGSSFKLLRSPILIDTEIEDERKFYIGYSLLAPYMSAVRGAYRIKITDKMTSSTPVQLAMDVI